MNRASLGNLLKRLERSVAAFRLTLRSLGANISRALDAIGEFKNTGRSESVSDYLSEVSDFDPEEDDLSGGRVANAVENLWRHAPGM